MSGGEGSTQLNRILAILFDASDTELHDNQGNNLKNGVFSRFYSKPSFILAFAMYEGCFMTVLVLEALDVTHALPAPDHKRPY